MKHNPSKYDRVILRRWAIGECKTLIAIFPDELGTNSAYTCSSYEHVGQHGSCDFDHVRRISRPVTAPNVYALPDDARDLIAELRQIGYHPRLVQRMPRDSLAIRRAALKAMDAAAETRALDAKHGFGAPTE